MDVIAPPGGVPVAAAAPEAVAVAAAQPGAVPEPNWAKLRLRWAQALAVLGFAAAALAIFAVPTAAALLGGDACAPTAAEAEALRAASKVLLLAAAAQVLRATIAVLFEECMCPQLFTVFATALGCLTGLRAKDVLWLLVACHGHVHGDLGGYYWFFFSVLILAFIVGCMISCRRV